LKTKILFVCLGNICRSPIAEGIFLHLLKSQPDHIKDCFEVDSAGTSNYHTGELPDVRMRQTAESHNIHLTSRARTINASDLDYYDLVIAMDLSNLRDIQA
jgi:protein-tyrosine phosphatase